MSSMLEARAAGSQKFLQDTGLNPDSPYTQAYLAMYEAGWLAGYVYALKSQEERDELR